MNSHSPALRGRCREYTEKLRFGLEEMAIPPETRAGMPSMAWGILDLRYLGFSTSTRTSYSAAFGSMISSCAGFILSWVNSL